MPITTKKIVSPEKRREDIIIRSNEDIIIRSNDKIRF